MKYEEIDMLPAGRDLDTAVHAALGHVVDSDTHTYHVTTSERVGPNDWRPVPRYSTGNFASGELAFWLKHEGVEAAGLDPVGICQAVLKHVARST